MLKLNKLYPSLIVGSYLLPFVASAQDIPAILTNIKGTMNTIIGILFILATLVFLWGIVQFIAGSGDPAKRDKAKGLMMWGIVGLAVMAAAWGITNIIIDYFGIPEEGPGFVQPPGN